MNDTVAALLYTAVGAVVVKVAEGFILPKRDKFDLAAQIRDELRDEIADTKQEVKDLRYELDQWKLKYYTLLEIVAQHNIPIPDDLRKFTYPFNRPRKDE